MNGSQTGRVEEEVVPKKLSNDLFIQTSDDSQCIGWSNFQVNEEPFFVPFVFHTSIISN